MDLQLELIDGLAEALDLVLDAQLHLLRLFWLHCGLGLA